MSTVVDAAGELLVDRSDGVLTITFNRPERGNALIPAQRAALVELFDEAGPDLSTRAIVLRGAGADFCIGSDARAARPAPPRPEGAPPRAVGFTTWLIRTGVQQLIRAMVECEKPVIASVGGRASNVGFHVVLAADFVVASSAAVFAETFVAKGILPDGGGFHLLPRVVGLQRAKEIVMLGDDLDADRALALGIVNRVVEPAELDAATADLAERLAAGPTKALGMAKQLLNRSLDTDLATSFYEEAHAQELVTLTADAGGTPRDRTEPGPRFQGW